MTPVLLTAVSVFFLMSILWIIHLRIKNASVVDIGWGLGFIIAGLMYITFFEGFNVRNSIMLALVSMWGLRIAIFIIQRISHEKVEDKRYAKLRESWGDQANIKFFSIFQFQALLILIISAPLWVIAHNPSVDLKAIEWLGIMLAAAGLLGEVISDEQLKNFKRDPKNKGQVCQVGLWYYSRHPNYFFEWVIWVGFYIFALGDLSGWWSIIAPIVMLYLLLKVSGVPMAEEQSLKSRGDLYREYQRTTSVFVPLPKRT